MLNWLKLRTICKYLVKTLFFQVVVSIDVPLFPSAEGPLGDMRYILITFTVISTLFVFLFLPKH